MKIFSVILGDIPGNFSDISFGNFLNSFRLEWWRYTPLNYFIATPNSYDAKKIFEHVKLSYPGVITAVFEVNVLDWYGIGPIIQDDGKNVSFLYWFEKITDKNYKPAWERNDEEKKYISPFERMTMVETKKHDKNNKGNS